MAGKFIRAAYRILYEENKPLTPEEMIAKALEKGILTTSGKTPANTMRARISDDIRKNGNQSTFQRTGANRFFIREQGDFNEYIAAPFEKKIPNEITVCIGEEPIWSMFGEHLGFVDSIDNLLKHIDNSINQQFILRPEAEKDFSFKQLVAYVWLETSDGLVISYERGKYSSADELLLKGKMSLGFGGHVLKGDVEDIFSGVGGIKQAAIREISEEIDTQFLEKLDLIGAISDNSSYEGQKHLGIVLKGVLADSNNLRIRSNERSINKLKLLSKKELWDYFHRFEFWSQILVKRFAQAFRPSNISNIIPKFRPKNVENVVIVGEIASGKTSLSEAICESLNYKRVNAGACVADLIDLPKVTDENRTQFQELALDFINKKEGPEKLAASIHSHLIIGGKNVVDGLRQISTLKEIKKIIPSLIVIYVDSPRNRAYENYSKRWPGATVSHFAEVREHPVESDIPKFRFEADAIINNADSLEKTVEKLVEWLK